MKRTTTLAQLTLATLATLGLGLSGTPAKAQTNVNPVRWGPKGVTYVTRGPNGAAHIVNQTPQVSGLGQGSGSPDLVTRGPNGAAHIVERGAVGGPTTTNPENLFPGLRTRGPNGAAHIVD